MDAFNIEGDSQQKLMLYPKGQFKKDTVYLSVWSKPDWEGYHSIESLDLSDEQVDALHAWLGKVIEERK